MGLAENLKKFMNTELMAQMEFLKQHCEEELRNSIQRYVYDKYTPTEYKRTYQLLNAVTSSDIIISGNTISFKVYIDPDKMNHYSIAGEEAKGINPGEEVYVVPLVEDSHGGLFYREGTPFMDQYINEIQEDLNQAMVKYIITKISRASYKK